MENIKIPTKNIFQQLFCKHDFVDGILDDKESNPMGFFHLQGETITTICQKCGKVKGTYFRKYDF